MAENKLEQLSPGSKMGLFTEGQRKYLVDFLVRKCGTGKGNNLRTCVMCQTDAEWSISEHVLSAIVMANGSPQLGGAVYPYVALTCSNCGNTHFFNALIIGLVKKKPDGTLTIPEFSEEKKDAK